MQRWCPDSLWELAEPLIPAAPSRRQGGGRRRTSDRALLAAMLFAAQAGCSWWSLPAHLFGTTRATAHRRFSEWTDAGLWVRLHRAMLDQLRRHGGLDFDRAMIDSVQVRAVKGDLTGPSPVDRGKPGSKIHVITDRGGLPLAADISAANTPDAALLLPLLDALPSVRGRIGRPRRWPGKLHADKAYDQRRLRREIAARGIKVRIARKGVESSQRLGRHRWVVERTMSWLVNYRRLTRRYDRLPEHFHAFAVIACMMICYRRLTKITK
nr:IS5 family transposase [Actinocatenispora thailandica]